MPTYTAAATQASGTGTAAAYVTLNTGSARRALIREVGVFNGAATSSSVGMGTPANTPATSTTITPVAHDLADATATALLGTAWGTAPTAPTVFQRQTILGAAVGAGTIWKLALDERIILAKSAWNVLWNFGGSTSSANMSFYYEYDE